MPEEKDKSGNAGCLGYVLFVTALIVLDSFGVFLSRAGSAGYGTAALCLGLLGLAGGVVLGIYFSAKTVPPTARSRYYWLIGGLTGMAIATFIIGSILAFIS